MKNNPHTPESGEPFAKFLRKNLGDSLESQTTDMLEQSFEVRTMARLRGMESAGNNFWSFLDQLTPKLIPAFAMAGVLFLGLFWAEFGSNSGPLTFALELESAPTQDIVAFLLE
jgi:hypothetical protein